MRNWKFIRNFGRETWMEEAR